MGRFFILVCLTVVGREELEHIGVRGVCHDIVMKVVV